MNSEDNIIEANGLNRNSNDIILPPGSLIAGDECIIVKDNIISRRRGFKECNTGLPSALPAQLFVSSGKLYVNIADQLYYQSSACSYSRITGVNPVVDGPVGVWANATDIYISESITHIIIKIRKSDNYVSIVAGTPGVAGSADGAGSIATFDGPAGLWGNATDLYICDFNNSTIRSMNLTTNVVSTWAGLAGAAGNVDGIGAAVRFDRPIGIWGDGVNLYVSDYVSYVIRQGVIATANVITWAGLAYNQGGVDGVGAAARFALPSQIWDDGTYLYVADILNDSIRRITKATADVVTWVGSLTFDGYVDATGTNARFRLTTGVTGDGTNLYISDYGNRRIRKAVLATAVVTTIGGNGVDFPVVDGAALSSTFPKLNQCHYNSGILYICESDGPVVSGTTGNIVRKFDISTGTVITFLGNPLSVTGVYSGYTNPSLIGPT